jgi:hypothetical protein
VLVGFLTRLLGSTTGAVFLILDGHPVHRSRRVREWVSINTVTKLLIDAGRACAKYQYDVMRALSCKRLQLDEIWGFVYAKERNVPTVLNPQPGIGSIVAVR